MHNELQRLIDVLALDRSLDVPRNLRQRIEALERLESHLILAADACAQSSPLVERAEAMSARLEAINAELYGTIRDRIRQGGGRTALSEWSDAGSRKADPLAQATGESYDYLDALISGVLGLDEPGEATAALPAEMVFYQPTPARHIFALIERIALTERDVFVDLGAGLGHVPLVAAVCTDARCIGIELQPEYVDCASRCARSLNLSNATFIRQDAQLADLGVGSVFYLYTPFTGTVLRTVLDSLQRTARSRPIRIVTFGPCTQIVAQETWLRTADTLQRDRIAIFRSSDAG